MSEYQNIPIDGDLSAVRAWKPEARVYVWTVVCRCGNNRLLLVGIKGVRCHNCGAFHTRDSFERASMKARNRARFADEGVVRTSVSRTPARTHVLNASTGMVSRIDSRLAKFLSKVGPPPRPTLTGSQIVHRRNVKLVSAPVIRL